MSKLNFSSLVVVPNLRSYQQLVHAMCAHEHLDWSEFTFNTPLYKATPALSAALNLGMTGIEKFDLYFEHAVLDEEVRVDVAQKFRKHYVKRFPGSERSDLFLASGELLDFRCRFKAPTIMQDNAEACSRIQRFPYDQHVFEAFRENNSSAFPHSECQLKLFFDHIYNPRHLKRPEVQMAMQDIGVQEPILLELASSGAIPGYFYYLLEALIGRLSGRLVWMVD